MSSRTFPEILRLRCYVLELVSVDLRLAGKEIHLAVRNHRLVVVQLVEDAVRTSSVRCVCSSEHCNLLWNCEQQYSAIRREEARSREIPGEEYVEAGNEDEEGAHSYGIVRGIWLEVSLEWQLIAGDALNCETLAEADVRDAECKPVEEAADRGLRGKSARRCAGIGGVHHLQC